MLHTTRFLLELVSIISINYTLYAIMNTYLAVKEALINIIMTVTTETHPCDLADKK